MWIFFLFFSFFLFKAPPPMEGTSPKGLSPTCGRLALSLQQQLSFFFFVCVCIGNQLFLAISRNYFTYDIFFWFIILCYVRMVFCKDIIYFYNRVMFLITSLDQNILTCISYSLFMFTYIYFCFPALSFTETLSVKKSLVNLSFW